MKHGLLRQLFCSTALGLAVAFAAPAGAQAPKSYDFAIPKAPLGQVLTAIARAGGVTFSVPSDLVAGRDAGPISGRDTLEGALSKALSGTGLAAERRADGSFALRKQQDMAQNGAGSDADIETIDVTDTGNRLGDQGFKAGNAGTVARVGDAPVKEIPLAVTGVTKETIRSQQAKSVADIARNVAGVMPQGGGGYNIRGFNVSTRDATIYKGNATGGNAINSDFVERVTVLKGPSSILTGRTNDGGVIDVEPKTADGETRRDLTVKFNTQGGKGLFLDFGGQLPQSDGLNLRLLARGAIDGSGGLENLLKKSGSILPSLSWDNDVFRQEMSVSYSKDTNPQPSKYQYPFLTDPAGKTLGVGAPFKFNPQSYKTNTPMLDKDITILFDEKQSVQLGELLGANIEISNRFSYNRDVLAARNLLLSRYNNEDSFTGSDLHSKTAVTSDHLEAELRSEEDIYKNTLNIGYDYSRSAVAQAFNDSDLFSDPSPITHDNPSYVSDIHNTIVTNGFFAVDKLDLFEHRLHILGSARWDTWTQKLHNEQIFYGAPISQRNSGGDHGVSWTAGAVYDFTELVSGYVNASHGVKAGQPLSSGTFSPTQTRNLAEGGLRFNLLDDELSITTSIFDQEKTGVVVSDRVDKTKNRVIKSQKAQGVELQIDGEVTSNLRTTLGLSYTDSKISGFLSDNDGISSGIPKYSGSLWTVYSFDESTALSGLSLGFGLHGSAGADAIIYQNSGEASYKVKTPSYVIADASAYYEKDNWSLGIKVNNIFDKLAFMPGTGAQTTLITEDRRTAYIEARVKF